MHYRCEASALQKRDKFLNRQFGLNNNGFCCFRRQIAAMQWNYDVKVRLHIVAKIGVATRLMMHVKTRSQ